jgi:bifunctional ADP-heptose synthase (sugar kinase/adenylyltransferase)
MSDPAGTQQPLQQQPTQPPEACTKVFVSGCYDVLHGGHVEFFSQARALGTHLTVRWGVGG